MTHATVSAPAVAASREFLARARARLTLEVPDALTDPTKPAKRGDMDLDPDLWVRAGVSATRPATVLIGIVARPEPAILFTQRSAHLPSHPGQISLPGGKIDDADPSPFEAAVREAHEEIGLDPALVEPVGYLDLYLTMSGYRVLPAVGLVQPSYRLELNANEVDDAFEVPLAFLIEPANHLLKRWEWRGIARDYYEMPYEGRRIWGVTAGILRNLYERVYGD